MRSGLTGRRFIVESVRLMGTDRDIEAHGCLLWERTLEGLRRSAPPSTKRLPSTGERSDRLN